MNKWFAECQAFSRFETNQLVRRAENTQKHQTSNNIIQFKNKRIQAVDRVDSQADTINNSASEYSVALDVVNTMK